MFEFYYIVESFIHKGGNVLILIFLVAFMMYTIILDRLYYLFFIFKLKNIKSTSLELHNYSTYNSYKQKLEAGMSFLKLSIFIAPLLGLLGTVTGMIEVFDVIAIVGNSDAKAMSSGISRATIPTMVGMSVALSGMAFRVYLVQKIKKTLRLLSERLHLHKQRKK